MHHNPISTLLKTYPRTRPPLSKEFTAIYDIVYKNNRSGKGLLSYLSQSLESWMHKKVAHGGLIYQGPLLELGAGTLNHRPYEKDVISYDVVEPFTLLYEDSPDRATIRHFFPDIKAITDTSCYNRIISIAALEHICDLPTVLQQCTQLLAKDGLFQAAIPSEGGLLWRVAWECSMGLSFKLRTGLNYGELMRHEHVSNAVEIISLIRYYFHDVTLCRFPLQGHHTSLYCYIEAKNPRITLPE